ncbi:EamA family transporter [Methanothermobacter sp. THM-2]|nr:EamA family transporter [Methanothermobacter sp. THM-2]
MGHVKRWTGCSLRCGSEGMVLPGTGWYISSPSGQLFYYYALKSGEASIVVPVVAAFPVFTLIVAAFLLGERVTAAKAIGLLMVVGGVVLIRI